MGARALLVARAYFVCCDDLHRCDLRAVIAARLSEGGFSLYFVLCGDWRPSCFVFGGVVPRIRVRAK